MELKLIIDSYPTLEGSKILKLLADARGVPIISTAIEMGLSGCSMEYATQRHYHPLGIPLTDSKTLQDTKKRLNRLVELKAEYISNRGCENCPYDTEIAGLVRYLKECTKPNGSIKNHSDEIRRAYRRQYAAIRRLFAKAEADGLHDAVAIVKKQLKLGYSSRLC